MAKKKISRRARRCLIVERHLWETGGHQQQLQFPLAAARNFWGSGDRDRRITVHIRLGPTPVTRQITISREYANGTRRTNGFPEMGDFPTGFVFFQETTTPDEYDVWWQIDVAVVAARYSQWRQGQNTQYGRGRLAIIVAAPVPRPIDTIN